MIGAIAGLGMGSAAWADPDETADRRSPEERVEAGDAGRSSESRPWEARRTQARVPRRDRTGRAAAAQPSDAGSRAASALPGPSAPDPAGARGIPPFPPLPRGAAQVEELTDEGATLLPVDGSREVMVYRWQLPPDVKEGDVVVDGRVDERATELLRQWIRDALAEIEKQGHPIPLPLPTLTDR